MRQIFALDVGITTGWALLRLCPDKEVRTGTFTVDELRACLEERTPWDEERDIVIEIPRFPANSNLVRDLYGITALVQRRFPNATYLTAADWKQKHVVLQRTLAKEYSAYIYATRKTAHERDALLIAATKL